MYHSFFILYQSYIYKLTSLLASFIHACLVLHENFVELIILFIHYFCTYTPNYVEIDLLLSWHVS
ncbi:hypothetical protein C8R41DRAFT_400608 [Lentinula lateritia]|uniref:Uncharacterized protein n=1 Tax=Lentinula lateritia TaxID=40482 RepID=A0ABQ8VGE1_9AGAR|nr:hypothetical protein C8R41DRAFT_400608 [Lentinula lateritia]